MTGVLAWMDGLHIQHMQPFNGNQQTLKQHHQQISSFATAR
jgi:hypothetical protein